MSKWIAIYSVVDRKEGTILIENAETIVNVDIEYNEREFVKRYISRRATEKDIVLFHNIYRQQK